VLHVFGVKRACLAFDCRLHYQGIPERKLAVAAAVNGGEDERAVYLHQRQFCETQHYLRRHAGIQGPGKLARDRHEELLQQLRAQQNVSSLGVLLEKSARFLSLVRRIGVEQVYEDVGVEEKLYRW
jgi:hypothetical protein